ncbi:MAG: glycosyltransferase family 2 protein [Armatimonadetes bacterium]|nr:glycosyltransferase family 2 protein [Armatimonadota bacterium]
MKTSVIIVTYNGLEDCTRPCLESLFGAGGPEFEAVVVDNGSTDGTRGFLLEAARSEPRLIPVLNGQNRGFAGGNNDGIRRASGDAFILLNSDTRVTKRWIQGLTGPLFKDPSIGLTGPVSNAVGNEQRIHAPGQTPGEVLEAGMEWAAMSRGDRFETERLSFFCAALRRETFERIGPLDEEFGLGFYEDDDYCLRASRAGFRLACAEDVFIYHRGSASFGRAPEATRKLMESNRRLLERKHGPYRPAHPRDRQLALVGSYLSRIRAGEPPEPLIRRIENRLQVIAATLPKNIWKRILYRRRMGKVQGWIERNRGYKSNRPPNPPPGFGGGSGLGGL